MPVSTGFKTRQAGAMSLTLSTVQGLRKGRVECCLYAVTCPALVSIVMPRFTEQVEAAVEALSSDPAQPMDENEFIDASRLVYDGIRDIRKAVLMIRVSEQPHCRQLRADAQCAVLQFSRGSGSVLNPESERVRWTPDMGQKKSSNVSWTL